MSRTVDHWRPPRYSNAHFAEEQRTCYQLYLAGHSIRDIAAITGLSKSTVERRLHSEISETVDPLRAEYKRVMHDRYELLWRKTTEVIAKPPPLVSDGRVVRWIVDRDRDGRPIYGDPIPDTGAVLQAVAKGESILGRLAKLHGLEAPVQVDARLTETTQQDLEIIELINAARAKETADAATVSDQFIGEAQ